MSCDTPGKVVSCDTPGKSAVPGGQQAGGSWVLVVGPSGAGKDTLMALARRALEDEPRVRFARRIVTRSDNAFEDHETATPADFEARCRGDELVLHWRAHGLRYGIHQRWQEAVSDGSVVVCNVSRAILAEARGRLGRTTVVHITAPADVLAVRIAARGREAAGARVSRGLEDEARRHADLTITNTATPEAGAAPLIALLREMAGAEWH